MDLNYFLGEADTDIYFCYIFVSTLIKHLIDVIELALWQKN